MRRTIIAVLAAFALTVLAACQPATTEFSEEQKAAIADTVRQLADTFFEDFRTLNFDGAMAPWSSEIVWAENGILGTNRDSLTNAWRGVFTSIQEVTSGDWGEVRINVLGPTAAVFTASFDWSGLDTGGATVGAQGVWTTVWERTTQRWQIVQGHESFLPPPDSM